MSKGLLGKKVGMTQIFADDGSAVPVTVIQAGPCTVVGKRTPEKDKYAAVTLGFGEIKEKKLTKALKTHFEKSKAPAKAFLREFRLPDAKDLEALQVGQELKVDEVFKKGQLVDITGITKGRGFAGVIKMHHMAGFVEGHGTHEYFRHPGAVGQRKTPGKVWKGKRMPGHLGVEKVTIQNLAVVDLDPENHLLLVKGSIPGHRNGLVVIQPAVKGQ
jgi:large subunit ribosomal protein L3